MKLPRDLSGRDFAVALGRLERQSGSHLWLMTQQPSERHITIPAHVPLKIGTPNAILRDVERHASMSRAELLQTLFD